MNNSSDFMMYLHEDKLNRMRPANHDFHRSRLAGEMVESPFARVRSAISTWVTGSKRHNMDQS